MDTNTKKVRIGDLLKEYGYVDDDQIAAALSYQKEHQDVRLGAALIELGYVKESQVQEALSERLRMPQVELSSVRVDMEAVSLIPKVLANRYGMLALYIEDGALVVAMNDPMNFYAIEDIRQLTGMPIEIRLAARSSLLGAISYYYMEVDAQQAARVANASVREETVRIPDADAEGDEDTPVINLLSRLIRRAYSMGASDIHIEPFEQKTQVRMRIDGVMNDYVTLEVSLHASLIARIKIVGDMDIAEKRLPQDGHFRMQLSGVTLNLRASILPTVFGEKAVLRLLANNTKITNPATFGMTDTNFEKMRQMLESPNGIIYFTGPTGSGKTTTLYMILEELSRRFVNIATIEDPVEKNLPMINQTQVNNQAGLTFESGLRAMLRQDPDIIMVGETRDTQTASISVRAAVTGHLVLSTLHTNDAASSVIRLQDMGLMPYMISTSLVGVIAQRLMRRLCDECAKDAVPERAESLILGEEITKIRKPAGCPACNFTGYKGRLAIHEMLLVDRAVKEMIASGASAQALIDYAVAHQGMETLGFAARALVASGVTSFEELKKVAFYT